MAPTAEQLKQYLDGMVEGVLNDVDIDAAQLPVANGVALKQTADELAANPSDEVIIGRLRAALLILAGADPLEAMRELIDVAQQGTPPKVAAPGDLSGLLNGLGTPNFGSTPATSVVDPTAQTPEPPVAPAPEPPAAQTGSRRRRAPRPVTPAAPGSGS